MRDKGPVTTGVGCCSCNYLITISGRGHNTTQISVLPRPGQSCVIKRARQKPLKHVHHICHVISHHMGQIISTKYLRGAGCMYVIHLTWMVRTVLNRAAVYTAHLSLHLQLSFRWMHIWSLREHQEQVCLCWTRRNHVCTELQRIQINI